MAAAVVAPLQSVSLFAACLGISQQDRCPTCGASPGWLGWKGFGVRRYLHRCQGQSATLDGQEELRSREVVGTTAAASISSATTCESEKRSDVAAAVKPSPAASPPEARTPLIEIVPVAEQLRREDIEPAQEAEELVLEGPPAQEGAVNRRRCFDENEELKKAHVPLTTSADFPSVSPEAGALSHGGFADCASSKLSTDVPSGEVDDDNTLTAALHEQTQSYETVLPPVDQPKVRVAVIGAGPSGLSALWAFKDAQNPVDNVEIVCFEKSDGIGGHWSFDPSIPHSSQMHTSMYKDLWSNGPKEAGSEFLDYSYLEHFGKSIPSYPPRAAIADYIKGRAKKYDLTDNIRFKTEVTSVTWDDNGRRFELCAKNWETGVLAREDFHFVIVANGHFTVPHVPKFAGIETFPGEVLHSKDFRDARRFAGKRVLAIGGSLSAEDIALQCHKFGATSVTITNRHPMGYPWPAGISEVPLLTRVSGHTVHFLDGTQEDVDVIVICTGYEYSFPFLTPELKTNAKNTLVIEDLYKGIFFIERPELMYLGMQNQVYTFIMFDLQAMLARLAVSNKFVVPAKQNMVEDIHVWIQKQDKLDAVKDWHALQTEYLKELNSLVMLGDDKDILCQQMFDQAEDDKVKDILQFRNGSFASCFSGAQGVNPPAPWLESTEEVPLQEYLESLGSVDFTADEPPLDSALVTFPAKKHDLAEGNTQACPQPLHPAPVAAAVPDFPAAVQVEAVAASPACVPLQAIPAPPDRGTSAETDPPEVLKQSSQGKSRTGKAKGKARGNK
eukprot:CAMPEP_0203956506 /NCGR_PEP_ID=MMETSP0359-20131031/88741_1 /ASSEMBLY_ACC=CAM_ASM_000338 /TAXON_ID=268821 /ORGANISM="Scrippsiella Hangoei, Strain SHTV-5" /LENGTH=784 /DNA_ID=CAMNT_0050890253 /DNA_START=34 /DNA_END=2388 /DNA_ORIENTATION=+